MTVPHPSDEALDAGLGGERGAALLRELRARVGAPGAAPMCVAPEAAPDPASRSRFVLLGEQAALLRLGRGGRPAQAAALEGALDQFRSARTIWLPRAACTGGAGVIGPDGARLPGQVVPLTRAEDVVALLLYLGGSGSDSAGGARRALPTTGSKAGWTPDLDLLTELSDPWRDDEPDSRAPRPERRTNATAQLPAPPPAAPELVSHGWGAHSTQLATRDAPQPANQVRGPGTAHASSLWHVAVQEHVASIPPPAPDPLAWARAGTAPAAAPEDDAAAHAARALLGVYSSATWLLGAGGGARLPAAVASAAEAAVRCGLLRTRLSALAAALARPSGNALCPARHALSTAVEAVLAEQAREVAELPETVLERRRGEAGTAASLGPVTLLETLTHGGALVADVECVARCLLVADGAGGAGQLDALLEASAVEAAERAAARLPRGGVLASYLHDAVSSAAPAHAGALAPLYAAVLAPCVASALWWATTAAPLPHAAAVAACSEALARPTPRAAARWWPRSPTQRAGTRTARLRAASRPLWPRAPPCRRRLRPRSTRCGCSDSNCGCWRRFLTRRRLCARCARPRRPRSARRRWRATPGTAWGGFRLTRWGCGASATPVRRGACSTSARPTRQGACSGPPAPARHSSRPASSRAPRN
ncbi:unnamed protein product [Pedinophyceae sp. YPF-701]|nr:unnamed protein product [Pedinophyceae sp. YPF-701]